MFTYAGVVPGKVVGLNCIPHLHRRVPSERRLIAAAVLIKASEVIYGGIMNVEHYPLPPVDSFRYSRRFRGYGVDGSGAVWGCLKGGNRAADPAARYLRDWRRMKLRKNRRGGYLTVSLIKERGGRGRIRAYVHRIVLEEFVRPCPEGMEARHLDGKRINNGIGNLAWGTPVENAADKRAHGTAPVGSKNPMAKLTEADIPIIRAMSAAGVWRRVVAEKFGVTAMTIRRIVDGKTWRDA
jgi:hypothetical protein